MKKLLTGIAAGALAVLLFASSTFAAVTFNGTTGTGFVGKGDVQSALGWNNKQLQDNYQDLQFTYETVETYEITVEWTTGEGTRGEKTHTVEHKRSAIISGDIEYTGRQANQITGFYLTGFSQNPIVIGNIPEIGDEYPGNSGHVVTDVNLVSSNSVLKVNNVVLQQD